MDDRNRQLGASTTAPTLAPPCTECRGFNVPALVRGNWQRGTCPACGGAGTAEAQQARSAAQAACATDGDFGHVVEPAPARATNAATVPWPTPAKQPAPADATGEVLPLWECDASGDWSRGMFLPSHICLADGRATIRMGEVDPMEWEGIPFGTVEDAMRYADEAAKIAGHRLPADSMVFRPELADEVRGTAWEWRPGEGTYLVDINVSWSLDATREVIRALKQVMPREQAADALARILRVHGADVREVRS